MKKAATNEWTIFGFAVLLLIAGIWFMQKSQPNPYLVANEKPSLDAGENSPKASIATALSPTVSITPENTYKVISGNSPPIYTADETGVCGNGVCEFPEYCGSCATDCGCSDLEFCSSTSKTCEPLEKCGDNVCTPKEKSSKSCPLDCGN